AGAGASPAALTVTALTYNVFTSFITPAPDPEWALRLDHAAREIALLGPPDVIALQEVSRSDLASPAWRRENTAERLGRALGMSVTFTATLPLLPFYEEGNAILSRFPISRT